jgi:phosphatidylserine/phosphatidylglycerophosphate/cardiolipin synthase-like enzyme
MEDALLASLSQFKKVPFPDDYDSNIRHFYSPDDNVHGVLKAVLSSAKQSLLVSMYGEDDPELTDIILNKAVDPDVFVQVNLDKTQAAGRAEVPLVQKLRACPNTRVAVGMSANHKINHLKVAVVDGLYKVGGSTNWSVDGEGDGRGHGQNNECIVVCSRAVAHEATMKLNADHQIMQAQEESARTLVAA